jgi:hypothetical protein
VQSQQLLFLDLSSGSDTRLTRGNLTGFNRPPTSPDEAGAKVSGTGMTAGPSGSPSEPPISTSAARQIAGVFELPLVEVVLDAQQTSAWRGSADELLVWIERRHGWHAHSGLAYLFSLRKALHLTNQPPPTPLSQPVPPASARFGTVAPISAARHQHRATLTITGRTSAIDTFKGLQLVRGCARAQALRTPAAHHHLGQCVLARWSGAR